MLERSAVADALRTMAATRELEPLEFDMVLDAVTLTTVPRGESVYRPGERADAVFFVMDGLVQLQTEDEDTIAVLAYLGPGDTFGYEDLGAVRTMQAHSVGHTRCLRLPAAVFQTVVDRTPGLARRLGRIVDRRHQRQDAVVGAAARRSTRHVFADLYKMQIARSMLVIDPERCVRCGHCAWSCAAAHDDGVARLVRRGEKVITRLSVLGQSEKSLSIPNSCQHCKHAACMIDCPTGAIGRDLHGEVFIREELCTGCGNCAKACPWENIQLAVRKPVSTTGAELSLEVAVKCDLCRGFDGPACVQACPTDAITRLDQIGRASCRERV